MFTIKSFTFFIGLLVVPILLYNFIHKYSFKLKLALFIATALFVTITLMSVFSWWSYTSDLILLKHYGFNADGMNEAEFMEMFRLKIWIM